MGLNESKGNMYNFVTHTWNTIKGECYHDCSYCYMKRWGKLKPVRFDEKELKTDLGENNFIFVGSSCDMFSENIPDGWIKKTLDHCNRYDNEYLLQSKNPKRLFDFLSSTVIDMHKFSFCTTIETNRDMRDIMRRSPSVESRSYYTSFISTIIDTYITIEPIMRFDHDDLVNLIYKCQPVQVNIGADSGNNDLPEPSDRDIYYLINDLENFTKVKLKKNLNRIIKSKEKRLWVNLQK